MHNLGSNCVSTGRDPAFRRSDYEPSAENFGGAFAVQFNRKKKGHLNCSFGIQGASGANQQPGNADVFSQSLMPLTFPSSPKPDGRANFIASGSGDLWISRAVGPIRIHPLSLSLFPLCAPGAGSASQLAKFRLGQFPGDSNGPTVLSSYDCIVLVKWNHGVLPRCLRPHSACISVVSGPRSPFLSG
jgi:hypothetical protein